MLSVLDHEACGNEYRDGSGRDVLWHPEVMVKEPISQYSDFWALTEVNQRLG